MTTTTTRKKKEVKKVEEKNVSLAELLGMTDDVVAAVVEEPKSTKLTPFDFIGAVTFSKVNLIVDDETEKQYNPFIVNRGLSNTMDTVVVANEMNRRPHIDKKAQFNFLLKMIPKRKRYDKWVKQETVENLDLIKEYYGFSNSKATAALSILSEEQIGYIRNKLSKGGTA